MRNKVAVILLTDEEIAKLPFPETAKLIGGIAVPQSCVDPKAAARLMKEFKKALNSVKSKFKTPKFDVCHICGTSLNNGRSGTYCAKCD